MVGIVVWQQGHRAGERIEHPEDPLAARYAGAASPDAESSSAAQVSGEHEADSAELFSVLIRKPDGPPRVKLAGRDPQGRSPEAACSTCHSIRDPNFGNTTPATLDEFHQGLSVAHGNLACYACHNPQDADTLRLADGTAVAYQDVMTMCSQCHSQQAESFAHGAHGGMTGHWDLRRGPQMKINCIDCHDPHSPVYPKMVVGFKPKDRFNVPADDHHDHEGADSHGEH
ncbi:hypothetical protein [Roseimaritima sediminicola]|uniref:hypothetical protein n=1 Tax=Roseimaritima sediminicola TaxID=2662066 RepID=UPI0012984D5A|nr:hypothetical protein [Roseimaritima sediminicola]